MPLAPFVIPLLFLAGEDPVGEGVDPVVRKAADVLEQNCLECHNPEKKRGKLDLSTREALLLGGAEGPAAIAGNAEQSLLVQLIRHEREPEMPYRRDALSATDVESVIRWINEGARYERPLKSEKVGVSEEDRAFWSFQPLRRPPIPEVSDAPENWSRHPVDRFLLAALRNQDLQPAARAERATLLRRASFDLLGLPPTPEELQAFVEDRDPEAWEHCIERLLASSHYGERWGRHWLDVARYADSGGYEFDIERPTAWPYRDFVIDAFNQDLPFDTFLRWQIAGDETSPDDPFAVAATGFLASGPTVGNQETEKNRYDELDDILSTTTSAILGLTVGCARCHDHKYDPIPSRDYYRMLAAFTTSERRDLPRVRNAEWQAYLKQREEYDKRVEGVTRRHHEWLATARQKIREQRVDALTLDERSRELLKQPSDPNSPRWHYTIRRPPEDWSAPQFNAEHWKEGPGGFGNPETPGSLVGTEWRSRNVWMRREFEWNEGDPSDLTFVVHHDDEVEIFLNGVPAASASGYLVEYEELAASDGAKQALLPGKNLLAVHCSQDSGGQFVDVHPVRKSSLVDRAPRALVLETEYKRLLDQHGAALQVKDEELRSLLSEAELKEWNEHDDELKDLKQKEPAEPQKMLCVTDGSASPKESYLLKRGDPNAKQEVIRFGVLQVISGGDPDAHSWYRGPPLEAKTTHQRRALADWITDVDHGAGHLAARVMINRLWQHHFGAGIVGTPNDFGIQGERPTHPELLDWLACEFVAGGFTLKRMHRILMTSEAYQQDLDYSPDKTAKDPQNRFHARRSPQRLESEILRDAILKVSGCLNEQMGGPGVKPWIPPDAIATGSTEKWPKDVVDGPETWRRSVYVFVRRSVLMPMMEVFDCPDATASCARRSVTTTAPQALALLNNQFVRECARHFAERLQTNACEGREALVTQAWREALGREPKPKEQAKATEFLQRQEALYRESGLGESASDLSILDLCHAIFNLSEFLYVD